MKALVIKSTGSWFTLLPDDRNDSVQARLRGSLRLCEASSTAPVVVGDEVICGESADGQWLIEQVCDRRNYLVRRSTNLSRQKHIIGANIDTIYVVVSLAKPATSLEFIDRVLVGAAAYAIEAKIVVNKVDSARPNEIFEQIYQKAGYQLILTSTITGEGIEALRADIGCKKVLFTGNSGVGKSSLINAIDAKLSLRVGEISAYHSKGKHTTTFSEIFPISGGGYLIDTPGIKGFGVVDVEPEQIYHYFGEIMRHSAQCLFDNCTHTHEPQCAVREAVERGHIAEQRYDSYVKLMADPQAKYR